MASTTSLISLFILLLATYSCSAPIEHEFESSITNYEFSINTTSMHHERSVQTRSMPVDGLTGVTTIHKERASEESSSEEVTITYAITPSIFEDSSVLSSTEINDKRSVENFSFPSST